MALDDATRARLEAMDQAAKSPAIWAVTLRVEDYQTLRAAYDALVAAHAQAAPVLAALEKWVNYAHHEELLDAVATWRAAREA